MERIVIIGNSGSGKSYLAQRLSDYYGYPVIHLDALFWEPGGFNVKRPKEIVYAEIATLVHGENWIVEGVFGELAQPFLANADHLIWLDIDHDTCLSSLRQRGSESFKQLDKPSAEENFQKLLAWASAYWQREDLRSYRGHAHLFAQFNGKKDSFQTRLAVNEFIDSLQPRVKSAKMPHLYGSNDSIEPLQNSNDSAKHTAAGVTMRHTSDGITIDYLAIAILRHEDSVVLVQQQGDDNEPFWVLPGGLVEAGELITDALIREVLEEAGVQVTAITQLACLIQMDRPDHQSQSLLFAFEVGAWHGTLRSNDPDDEILAVELVPRAEAIRRLAGKGGWPGMQTALLTYLRGDVPAGTVWCYREDEAGQHLMGRFPA